MKGGERGFETYICSRGLPTIFIHLRFNDAVHRYLPKTNNEIKWRACGERIGDECCKRRPRESGHGKKNQISNERMAQKQTTPSAVPTLRAVNFLPEITSTAKESKNNVLKGYEYVRRIHVSNLCFRWRTVF